MAVTIRRAVPQDDLLIAEMSRRTFYDTFASSNTKEDMDQFMNEVFTLEALKQESHDPANIFLLAYDDNKPLGYARLREGEPLPELNGEPALEVARIYAEKDAIGKGIGRALMEAAIEVAIAQQKTWVWLGVWEKNERAIAFYTKWGFEKFATHDFPLGSDVQCDWLMKKRLKDRT